jgi:Leucine-rich repeat (LRR) protein
MNQRIAPWEETLPDDMTPEQGMRLALDRIDWREQGYPDLQDFDGWSNPPGLDYLLNRPSMDTLTLSGLKLDRFPDGLERLVGIDYLFLMNNRITDIPDAYLDNAEVMSLHLFDNAIALVPAKLFAMRRMEELYLGRNPIREVVAPEDPNPELKFLLLDQCQGIQVPDKFFD